ncbi:MAG: hypothetical protein RIC55_34515 [Pirellulaceae bacterium]
MGKLLRLLTAGVMYFCAATIIAQCIGLGVLWQRGVFRSDHAYEMLALLQGIDLDAIREKIENTRKPVDDEQVSFEQITKERLQKTLTLTLRERAIRDGLSDLQALEAQVRTERERLDDIVTGFEQRLGKLEQAATDTALQEVQRTLESIDPGQAKDQILMMLEDDLGDNQQGMNDVVTMIRSMPLDKRKKILGEFQSKPEMEKLHEILARLREGEPEVSLIRDTQQQLGES